MLCHLPPAVSTSYPATKTLSPGWHPGGGSKGSTLSSLCRKQHISIIIMVRTSSVECIKSGGAVSKQHAHYVKEAFLRPQVLPQGRGRILARISQCIYYILTMRAYIKAANSIPWDAIPTEEQLLLLRTHREKGHQCNHANMQNLH